MKGFLFDLDNTLYDRYGTLRAICEKQADRLLPWLNPGYTLEKAIDHLLHTEPLYIPHGWKPVYQQLIAEHFFNADNTPSWKEFAAFIVEGMAHIAVPFPFTVPVLTELKKQGYIVGLVTNNTGWQRQYIKVDLLGIRELFDIIVVSGEYAEMMCGDPMDRKYEKPAPDIFLYAAAQLGVKPEELYYVGDNPINDVTGARNAGMVPVWIRSRSPWVLSNAEIPELCFDTVEGCLTLIGK
jgi:putative hydrolase of the HAD superfamily